MRKIITLLIVINPFIIFCQPFSLTDTVFSKNQFTVLYDIRFNFADKSLQPDQPQLDSLVDFLIKYDTLEIEIGVHTGFRGQQSYNLEISEERAQTICNYLIKNKIDSSRLQCIGFGENKPVIEYEDWEKIAETHRCGFYEKGNRRVTVVLK